MRIFPKESIVFCFAFRKFQITKNSFPKFQKLMTFNIAMAPKPSLFN